MAQDYIERIKKIKSERKITTEDLAASTGIPASTLSKAFAGLSESIKLSNLVAICNTLDVSLDYIVSGTPENTNNFTLNAEEIRLVDGYRRLDRFGRDFVQTVIEKETERIASEPAGRGFRKPAALTAPGDVIFGGASGRFSDTDAIRRAKLEIPFMDLAVSAGTGEYLDCGSASDTIRIPDTAVGRRTNYALRINGSSMEPKYLDKDVLLVEATDSVDEGELGIFVLDGCGYFKQFGGDRLISLNPEFGPILLKDYESVSCRGRVIGKIKRK